MKFIPVIITGILLIAATVPASAQRDVNTSSARAAYSMPSSNYHVKSKKKKKKDKKLKSRKARKTRKAKSSIFRQSPVGL